jgi:hypothetical protein
MLCHLFSSIGFVTETAASLIRSDFRTKHFFLYVTPEENKNNNKINLLVLT